MHRIQHFRDADHDHDDYPDGDSHCAVLEIMAFPNWSVVMITIMMMMMAMCSMKCRAANGHARTAYDWPRGESEWPAARRK